MSQEESPTVNLGLTDYLRGLRDEALARCANPAYSPPATVEAALAEQRRRANPAPHRVQRKRVKGYRMPPNTVSVTRPGPYGNPYAPADYAATGEKVTQVHVERAVNDFRRYAREKLLQDPDWLLPLRGKNLACFCGLLSCCHADVLLELANP